MLNQRGAFLFPVILLLPHSRVNRTDAAAQTPDRGAADADAAVVVAAKGRRVRYGPPRSSSATCCRSGGDRQRSRHFESVVSGRRVTGTVTEVTFHEGDFVRKATPLTIDPRAYEALLDQPGPIHPR